VEAADGEALGALMALFGCIGLPSSRGLAAQVPKDPIYIRIDNGWKGLYGQNDEYAEFSLVGKEIELQDPYHVSLKQGLGMMVTFAEKKNFAGGKDLLADHLRWELDYWRSQASRVESTPRSDLSGARTDLRITEINVYNKQGDRTTIDLLGLAAKEGVFVLSISPGGKGADAFVKEVAGSFKLVHRTLDPEEVKNVAKATKTGAGSKQ
jgi:hypothetical protein